MFPKKDSCEMGNYINYTLWEKAIIKSYNLKTFDINYNASTIKLFGYKKKFSTGAYGSYGGFHIGDANDIPGLVESLLEFKKNKNPDYILIKADYDFFKDYTHYFKVDLSYSTYILELSNGVEYIWKKLLNKKTRNQTRKGLKQKLEVRFGYNELFEDYFKVISRCWRDLGTPTHSKIFHKNISDFYKDILRFIVIYYSSQPISAAMLIKADDTLHHPFAGTIKKFNNLSVNNVLYWSIIKWACNDNIKFWDMGRSPNKGGGAKYKLSWGAEEKQLYYYYMLKSYKHLPNYNKAGIKAATTLWKYAPLAIANKFGPYFIKNIL